DITDDSVMINEKMAKELSVKAGDTISVTVDDKTAELTVGGVFEQYIKNYVYISPKLYAEKFCKEPEYNMAQVVLNNPDEQNKFGEKMLQNDKIAGVTYLSSGIDEIEDMLNSLNMVVLVMIICAAALAFVVLYNLTNINIAERVREIATFKVLGFYSKETSSVIYKENIVLTLGGIVSGLVMGIFLTGFIIQTVEVDNVMFGREILPTSFIFAALLTLAFALLVNFVMGFKIKKVNMVESLKSVE
uniref:ABC transporter permease n=1 Tax=Ruminococcus sp. TaxID=41978 RepID=UPI0038643F01